MTALVLETRRLSRPNCLRRLLTRFARFLDDLVSARAARSVPEWRMREVQAEIDRHVSLIRAARLRPENSMSASYNVVP
jgi:hypothetical protein